MADSEPLRRLSMELFVLKEADSSACVFGLGWEINNMYVYKWDILESWISMRSRNEVAKSGVYGMAMFQLSPVDFSYACWESTANACECSLSMLHSSMFHTK